MSALRRASHPRSGMMTQMYAGASIAFGAAVIRTAADTVKGVAAANSVSTIGFAVEPANGVVGDQDGFALLTNARGVADFVRVVHNGYVNALVCPDGNYSILKGDFLEIYGMGDASGNYLGILNEAGSNAGETRTATCVAQAMEEVTQGSAAYCIPETDVAIGAATVTLTAAKIATLKLTVGSYVVLEDINGGAQLNRVLSMTATVVTLQFPSTVALTASDSDLIYRVDQILVRIL